MMNLSLAELCNWNRPVHPSLPLSSPFPDPSTPSCLAAPRALSDGQGEMESPQALGKFLGGSILGCDSGMPLVVGKKASAQGKC